jgi:hypothetical protein
MPPVTCRAADDSNSSVKATGLSLSVAELAEEDGE